jgi:hypothetical protein
MKVTRMSRALSERRLPIQTVALDFLREGNRTQSMEALRLGNMCYCSITCPSLANRVTKEGITMDCPIAILTTPDRCSTPFSIIPNRWLPNLAH